MAFPAFAVSGEYGDQAEGINTNDHEKGHSNQICSQHVLAL